MRWQIRAEERKALDDLLGAARRQAWQARRDPVRGAAGLRETVARGSRPPARHALGVATRPLSRLRTQDDHQQPSGPTIAQRSNDSRGALSRRRPKSQL